MLRLDTRMMSRSLAELLEVRQELRRQEILLQGALLDLQAELQAWRQQPVTPVGVARLYDDLEGREHELATDLVQVRQALYETCREIGDSLARPRSAAG